MTDSLQKIRDEMREGAIQWRNVSVVSPCTILMFEELTRYADRIDALLAESEAAVWRCNREGVLVEAECRPGCGCRDLPDSDKFYTAPQPQVPEGYALTDPRDEFERLLPALSGTDKWTADERIKYFGFFCHGWYGRAGEAEYQREGHNAMIAAAREVGSE